MNEDSGIIGRIVGQMVVGRLEVIEPPAESPPNLGGSIRWKEKKKKPTVIRYSDFTSREAYAAALAQAAIPIAQISDVGVPEDDFEDEDEILFAIVRILH